MGVAIYLENGDVYLPTFFNRNFDKNCEDISCGYVKKHYCMFPTCIYIENYTHYGWCSSHCYHIHHKSNNAFFAGGHF